MDFAIPADHKVKMNNSEKVDKYLDFTTAEKVVEHEGDSDTNCSWCTWNSLLRLIKETGELEIRERIKII